MNRRELMGVLGSLPFFALTGCTCPQPRGPVQEWSQATARTPLAPSRIAPKEVAFCFDAHAHLFNATDVHVAGYLKGPVAHDQPEQLRKLLIASAPVVEAIGQALAISCKDEMAVLAELLQTALDSPSLIEDGTLHARIDRERAAHRKRVVDELVKRLPGTDFGAQLDAMDRQYQQQRARILGRAPQPMKPLSQDKARLLEALTWGAGAGADFDVLTPRDVARLSGLDPRGVLQFVGFMVSPRHHNLREYQIAYSEGNGAFGVDACFAALVDFDYWLDCPRPASSLRDQVLLHEQLAVLSGGYVLPLVPYNPWTDIKRQDESFALVQWAIQHRGFVGVKLYPPMGYLPLGNDTDIGSPLDRPEGHAVDEKLIRLYSWCELHGVPVLTHASHSMGRDHAHDALASPDAWRPVFERFPGLRVNAGHFGGGYFGAQGYWPARIVELMRAPYSGGLYTDLAYEEAVYAGNDVSADNLRRLLEANPHAFDRLLYGTDWHMISQVPGWRSYAHDADTFLDSIPGVDHRSVKERVYYRNAVRFFGLAGNAENRTRLNAFYQRLRVPIPRWMNSIR